MSLQHDLHAILQAIPSSLTLVRPSGAGIQLICADRVPATTALLPLAWRAELLVAIAVHAYSHAAHDCLVVPALRSHALMTLLRHYARRERLRALLQPRPPREHELIDQLIRYLEARTGTFFLEPGRGGWELSSTATTQVIMVAYQVYPALDAIIAAASQHFYTHDAIQALRTSLLSYRRHTRVWGLLLPGRLSVA